MEPLPIMLFSFMFGFPLYRIVPLPAILVDIALFAVISIWVLPAALQVSSSVSRPNALILLLPALLIFIFSVLPLRETVPLPAISQSKRVMAMESAFIVPPPANLISSFFCNCYKFLLPGSASFHDIPLSLVEYPQSVHFHDSLHILHEKIKK